MKAALSVAFIIAVASSSIAQSHYPGQHEGKFAIKDKLIPAVYSFDLQDVKLLDSRFKQNMEREQQWLLSISANNLLHSPPAGQI